MKRRFLFILIFLCVIIAEGRSQKIIEFGIKPTEFLLLNFETNLAIGTKKTRYGLFFSYRPSTRDSGLVKSAGSGLAGGYGHIHFNRLYTSYTLGLYQKTYINKRSALFLETDIFYRNWSFDNKPAAFRNTEGYSFKGLRTENVDVYGLKILIGKTLVLAQKEKKYKPYIDLYAGAGIRYKEDRYETFNGLVGETYYSYKKDRFYYTWLTPQAGIKLGLVKINKGKQDPATGLR